MKTSFSGVLLLALTFSVGYWIGKTHVPSKEGEEGSLTVNELSKWRSRDDVPPMPRTSPTDRAHEIQVPSRREWGH